MRSSSYKISNLPVTSREYKLTLNPSRFRDRAKGSEKFWNFLKKIIKQINCDYLKYVEEFKRITCFMDTYDSTFYRHNYILRLRDETYETGKYKLTLKYRNPDRYIASSKNVSAVKVLRRILFVSKFSHSTSVNLKERPVLNKFKHAVKLFPGLGELEIKKKTRLVVPNNFKAFELTRWIGAFDLGNGVPVKSCLNFWYRSKKYTGLPIVAEFSFDYDMDESAYGTSIEKYPVNVVTNAARFFQKIQKSSWAYTHSKTKTRIAYELI